MKSRLIILTLLLSVCCPPLRAQRKNILVRYVESLINDTTDVSKPQFLVYPTLAYAPETRWEFGLSTLLLFYTRGDTTNRLSEINGFTFFTLENQYGIWFDHAYYSHESKWVSSGRVRFQSFPLLYHGIGTNTPAEPVAQVDANQIQIRERVLRKIITNLFTGIELDFQRLGEVEFKVRDHNPVQLPLGASGSANLGFGLGLLYDTRHNVLNVRDGLFSELALLHYNDAWGSDHTFTTVLSDSRFYKSVNKRDVIAAQVLGQFSFGEVPFNQLSLFGGESIMRGYYLGRLRDKNQLAAQLEYRFLPLPLGFTKRFGAVIFGGTGTVFPNLSSFSLANLQWAGGAGIRFLVFPKKDIFTRFDVAFTKERTGFYFFIGEAF